MFLRNGPKRTGMAEPASRDPAAGPGARGAIPALANRVDGVRRPNRRLGKTNRVSSLIRFAFVLEFERRPDLVGVVRVRRETSPRWFRAGRVGAGTAAHEQRSRLALSDIALDFPPHRAPVPDKAGDRRANEELEKDGIAPIGPVTFHSLRRTFASLRCACGRRRPLHLVAGRAHRTADRHGHAFGARVDPRERDGLSLYSTLPILWPSAGSSRFAGPSRYAATIAG